MPCCSSSSGARNEVKNLPTSLAGKCCQVLQHNRGLSGRRSDCERKCDLRPMGQLTSLQLITASLFLRSIFPVLLLNRFVKKARHNGPFWLFARAELPGNLMISLYFSLLSRNAVAETGSTVTASTTSHSLQLCRLYTTEPLEKISAEPLSASWLTIIRLAPPSEPASQPAAREMPPR